MGLLPPNMQITEFQTWEEMPAYLVTEAKNRFMCEKMSEIFGKCKDKTPPEFNKALVQHSMKITQTARSFMESNPSESEPQGFKKYPGKMDHVTALTVRVGPMWDEHELLKRKKRNARPFGKGKSKLDKGGRMVNGLNEIPKTVIRKYTAENANRSKKDQDQFYQLNGPQNGMAQFFLFCIVR